MGTNHQKFTYLTVLSMLPLIWNIWGKLSWLVTNFVSSNWRQDTPPVCPSSENFSLWEFKDQIFNPWSELPVANRSSLNWRHVIQPILINFKLHDVTGMTMQRPFSWSCLYIPLYDTPISRTRKQNAWVRVPIEVQAHHSFFVCTQDLFANIKAVTDKSTWTEDSEKMGKQQRCTTTFFFVWHRYRRQRLQKGLSWDHWGWVRCSTSIVSKVLWQKVIGRDVVWFS
jgi:hypothetical protein